MSEERGFRNSDHAKAGGRALDLTKRESVEEETEVIPTNPLVIVDQTVHPWPLLLQAVQTQIGKAKHVVSYRC